MLKCLARAQPFVTQIWHRDEEKGELEGGKRSVGTQFRIQLRGRGRVCWLRFQPGQKVNTNPPHFCPRHIREWKCPHLFCPAQRFPYEEEEEAYLHG